MSILKDQVITYTDASWGSDIDSRKSVTGYVILLMGGPIFWSSQKQSIVAQSTAASEYVAGETTCMEVQHMQNILSSFPEFNYPFLMLCDNQSAIILMKDPSCNKTTRHFGLKYHLVRDLIKKKKVIVKRVDTKDNAADLFTKTLPKAILQKTRLLCGIQNLKKENSTISLNSIIKSFDEILDINQIFQGGVEENDWIKVNKFRRSKDEDHGLKEKKKRNLAE